MKNLSSNKLLDILKTIPYSHSAKHGILIPYLAIADKLKTYGNSPIVLEDTLKVLADLDLIEIVTLDNTFNSDLIIGIRLK